MAESGLVFTILAALAMAALFAYLLFGGFHRAFQAVGFTREEASIIVFGSIVGGLINLPLFMVGEWLLAINVGGAIVPVVVTVLVLRRNPTLGADILAGGMLVAVVTYLITQATPEGIVTYPFAFVLPPMVAAGVSLLAHWRDQDDAAPVAYASGTIGALVGADVFRLAEFLGQTPPAREGVPMASLGGASVFDMVFLTGILAVLLDMWFFRRRAKEEAGKPQWEEYTTFTTSTRPEDISNWVIQNERSFQRRAHEEQRRTAAETARRKPDPRAPQPPPWR